MTLRRKAQIPRLGYRYSYLSARRRGQSGGAAVDSIGGAEAVLNVDFAWEGEWLGSGVR
jgi:hypothetical protein